MLGFGKKSNADRNKKADKSDAGAGNPRPAPGPGPLKLRQPGGMLTPGEQSEAPGTEQKAPLRPPKKTTLHLMTGREEKERAFQAAREHYLSKNLPSIRKETRRKQRNHAFDFIMDRLLAVVGFFLIVCGWIYLYQHGAELEAWWNSLIDGIKIL